MSDSLVIIPTYNEIENINSIVLAVMSLEIKFDVLVVDDGSPDGTAKAVLQLQKEFSDRIHLMERNKKSGLGTAYIAGFRWALEKNYRYILEMDADFSHPPQKLIELRNACVTGIADVAIGSRYTKGGGVVNWPFIRLALSRGASLYVRMITGMNVMDPTAGFVCYKSEVLENIGLDTIKFVGYAFQIEMKYKSFKLGYKLHEIPILFPDRVKGKSKMNILIIREALWGVFQMRWRA
ncbi:MAG: polyprenol monophosphomannose synthase [Saprospiraceae bacterium]|nr:polyprenol monophosphomannose synthase [Saprospiraceae bacterium]MBK7811259.1 polyprenol monophosphomannose synthase [Saprospiraceae bacterium]MBK9631040.1 polyprenol monophosphomannose synthase [Saprospiraceae bacterium]